MTTISEYDVRQLKLMRETLGFFEKKQIPLNSLIGRLFSLVSALDAVKEEWEEVFFDEVGTLEGINSVEIINSSGVDKPLPELSKEKKEILISKAVLNLNKIIENKLVRKLDEMEMRNLSFPNFEVEKIEFSLEQKTLKFFMEDVGLKENDEINLGKCVLFFSDWESLTITRFNPVTETWMLVPVENADSEYLKYICESKFFDSSVCLSGFDEKNQQLEWKIINTKMYAEFEPDAAWKEN